MALDHSRLLAASLTVALFGGVSCSTTDSADSPASESKSGTAPAAGTVATTPAAQAATQDPQGLEAARRKALVEKYLEVGQRLRAEGKLDAAMMELLRAKELDENNEQVRNLIAAVSAEQGNPVGTALSFHDEQERLAQIQADRRRSAVNEKLQGARDQMASMNFAGAVDSLRLATLDIEVANEQDWGSLPAQVASLRAEAEKKLDAQMRAKQEELSQQLATKLREEFEANQSRRRAQVDALLQQGQLAFQNRRFAFARELSSKALELEPNNAVAIELQEASIKASRDDMADSYYNEKAREIRKMLEAMEELKVPQTDVLRMDPETWAKAVRRKDTNVGPETVSPEDKALFERVRTEMVGRLTLTEENGDYLEVKNNLSRITGVPIIITPEAREVISSESLKVVIELVNPISLEHFLNHMVKRSTNLAWTVRHGAVVIGNKSQASGALESNTYDVRDLVFKRTQFLPPRIRDIPSDTDSGDTPRTGGEGEDKVAFVELDQLVSNIKEATDLKYWEGEGVDLKPEDQGYLVITASREMHQRIRTVLEDMRRFATSVVTIDAKFLTVSRNFLQEVGVDFRGLGGAGNKGDVATLDDVTNGLVNNSSRGLDNNGTADPAANPVSGAFYNDGGDGDMRARTENVFTDPVNSALSSNGGLTFGLTYLDDLQIAAILRAVQKSSNAELVNTQLISVMDQACEHVAIINQTSFVRDFDVEVAQASFIADPKVDVIQDGLVLDVRPVIQQDRKYIILDLQPTVAELVQPIPTFTTSLGASTLPVTMQLPTLTVTSFATTAKVPDGGSVLLGGLRQMLQVDRKSSVPLLADLPLISFLFKLEGSLDESSSLMVMVRAWITDLHDVTQGK